MLCAYKIAVFCYFQGYCVFTVRAGYIKLFYLLQLLNLCEAEDSALTKLPCYKSLPSLVPLRIAALSKLIQSKQVMGTKVQGGSGLLGGFIFLCSL